MAVQAVTRQVMWHGLILPDHEGYDRDRDEVACPDIQGLEDAGRPLKLGSGRRPSPSAEPMPARNGGMPQRSRNQQPLAPSRARRPAVDAESALSASDSARSLEDDGGVSGSHRDAA